MFGSSNFLRVQLYKEQGGQRFDLFFLNASTKRHGMKRMKQQNYGDEYLIKRMGGNRNGNFWTELTDPRDYSLISTWIMVMDRL